VEDLLFEELALCEDVKFEPPVVFDLLREGGLST
jgi:hypothetical protein